MLTHPPASLFPSSSSTVADKVTVPIYYESGIAATNHVIHLEGHWNPAKEAQATDRVYRIGQTRDVLVQVPILLHPERASYDLNLDKLLRSKMRLQDALTITAPEEVTADEVLKGIFGGQDGAPPHGTDRSWQVDDVAGLSWELRFTAMQGQRPGDKPAQRGGGGEQRALVGGRVNALGRTIQ